MTRGSLPTRPPSGVKGGCTYARGQVSRKTLVRHLAALLGRAMHAATRPAIQRRAAPRCPRLDPQSGLLAGLELDLEEPDR